MVQQNTALHDTAFTVSIDARGHDVTTGISAHDRATRSWPPLIPAANREILRGRAMFSRFALARAACSSVADKPKPRSIWPAWQGFYPAGVICEIINDDGTMARVPDLIRFCQKHDLVMVTVADLARYRFEADFEGSLAAIEGLFPVARCFRSMRDDLHAYCRTTLRYYPQPIATGVRRQSLDVSRLQTVAGSPRR